MSILLIKFHQHIFLNICWSIWLLDDILLHNFGLSYTCLYVLKCNAFYLYEAYYSSFNKDIYLQSMHPMIINSNNYHSYHHLTNISNNFKHPVVIRGLFKNSNAMNWNITYLNNTIGHQKCDYLLPNANYFEMKRESKLYSSIFNNITANGFNYVSGDYHILSNKSGNNLIHDFNFNEILGEEFINSDDFMRDEMYLFIGNKNGGTSLHAAPHRSMFVLVKGIKKWIFIDPKYSIYLNPQRSQLYSRLLLSFGGFVRDTNNLKDGVMGNEFLYRHIPHYEVILYPGDAVTVPSWWWHQVMNIEQENDLNAVNIGIDIDTKTYNYDFLRAFVAF